ncbi:helix-turn-helix domain-containing protein [Rhodococcus sp. 14-2470-1a]|uniref:helix-turn-helix domain-containing protein n=1 Tax=Rhodococcus sp. 14-2470-1a TaxID=2023150 RepID=UPI000B9B0399|nr:helix-turn-helix domain-containing protein [Rhodococcus sp. 14-2470-1a]OZF45738.1 AraC family transcriptional regulator [Rhodococcus sp. 14-2470-1a]
MTNHGELAVADTVGILGQDWVHPDRTSAGYGWRGVYLSTQDEQPYEARFDAARTHLIVLHLSGPATVAHGGGRHVERRTIPAGGFFVHPAGHELTVGLESRLRTTHANLDHAVLEEVAGGNSLELTARLGVRDPMIEQLLLAMDAALQRWQPSARTYVDHLTSMLAAHLVHHYDAARTTEHPPSPVPLGDNQLDDVIDEMKTRLAEPIPLADLASVASLSTSQLTRRFKVATGLTPHRYLMRLRVEHAAHELRTTVHPIADIALSCGFSHQEHLTRTMRAQLGATPGEVRRSH